MADSSQGSPIVVSGSQAPGVVDETVGQLIPILGALVVAHGLVSSSDWQAVAGAIPILLNVGYRIYRRWSSHAEKKVLAAAAPDEVGVVR